MAEVPSVGEVEVVLSRVVIIVLSVVRTCCVGYWKSNAKQSSWAGYRRSAGMRAFPFTLGGSAQ